MYSLQSDLSNNSELNAFCNYYNVIVDYITELSNNSNYDIINKEINFVLVGKKLKEVRQKEKLKQRDIFNLLNTTLSTYQAHETGKVLIQTSFIYKIAKKV